MIRRPFIRNNPQPQVQAAQPQAAPHGFTRQDAIVAMITVGSCLMIALITGLAIHSFNCGTELRLCNDELQPCKQNLTRCHGAVNVAVAAKTTAQIFGIKTPFVESDNETISLKTILDHEFTDAESGLACNDKEEWLNPNTLVFKVLVDARALEKTHQDNLRAIYEAHTQDRRRYHEMEGKVEALEQSKQLCEEAITQSNKSHEDAIAQSNKSHDEDAMTQSKKLHEDAMDQSNKRHADAMAQSNKLHEEALQRHREAMDYSNKLHKEAMAYSDKLHKEAMAYSDKLHKEAMAYSDKLHKEFLVRSGEEMEELRKNLNSRCAEELGRTAAAYLMKKLSWKKMMLKWLKILFP